jgi:hypothetical protein
VRIELETLEDHPDFLPQLFGVRVGSFKETPSMITSPAEFFQAVEVFEACFSPDPEVADLTTWLRRMVSFTLSRTWNFPNHLLTFTISIIEANLSFFPNAC